MQREQAVEVVKNLAAWFPSWKIDKDTAKIWIDSLVGEELELVNANIKEYLKKGNEFAPSLSLVIKNNSNTKPLPTLAEYRAEEEKRIQKSREERAGWII